MDPNPIVRVLSVFLTHQVKALLISLRKKFQSQAEELIAQRPLLARAFPGEEEVLRDLLKQEEERERKLDEACWAPLRKELEFWRRERAMD